MSFNLHELVTVDLRTLCRGCVKKFHVVNNETWLTVALVTYDKSNKPAIRLFYTPERLVNKFNNNNDIIPYDLRALLRQAQYYV